MNGLDIRNICLPVIVKHPSPLTRTLTSLLLMMKISLLSLSSFWCWLSIYYTRRGSSRESSKAFWIRTKIQVFDRLLDYTVNVYACGENIEFLDDFTYFGSVVQKSRGIGHDVFRRIGLDRAIMNSLDTSTLRLMSLQMYQDLNLQVSRVSCFTVWLWDIDTTLGLGEANWGF